LPKEGDGAKEGAGTGTGAGVGTGTGTGAGVGTGAGAGAEQLDVTIIWMLTWFPIAVVEVDEVNA